MHTHGPRDQTQDTRRVIPMAMAVLAPTSATRCETGNFMVGLNPNQRAAVEHTDGPLLIVAGAGSGKTRVLVTRIAYLVESCDVKPSEILAITFTKKAAHEMRERLTRILGHERAKQLALGTFHALGASLLREFGSFAGLSHRFTIVDDVDAEARARLLQRTLGTTSATQRKTPRIVVESIAAAKHALVDHVAKELAAGHSLEDVFSHYRRGMPELWQPMALQATDGDVEMFAELYRLYQAGLVRDNVVDYSDLVCVPVLLFLEHPEIQRLVTSRWNYLHIDEYQDTDFVQEHLLRILSARHGNICVVGDPAQAIYSWRGARIENIHTFCDRYAPCAVIRLEQNYRSTPTILNAANSLLQDRPELAGLGNALWTDRPDGDPIRVWISPTQDSEAVAIATDIERAYHNQEVESYDDILVLYRRNSLSRAIEIALQRAGIPYRIVGSKALHKRAVVRDLLAFLRFAENPADATSFERATNAYACGIGPSTVESLNGFSRVSGKTLLEIAATADASLNIRPQQIRSLHAFAELIHQIQHIAVTQGAAAALRYTIEATRIRQRILEALVRAEQEEDEEAAARIERQLHDIDDFVLYVEEFVRADLLERYYDGPDRNVPIEGFGATSLRSLLENIALLQPGDAFELSSKHRGSQGAVTLMTIHGAKGLEAKRVYVVGLEEGIFPSCLESEMETALDRPLDGVLAEEARLFYVALTRARDHLVLSASRTREIVRGDPRPMIRSRFLAGLPETLHRIEMHN